MTHDCEVHAEVGECAHEGQIAGMRLHLLDTPDASSRADETMSAFCELLGELSAPGWHVTGYRMRCDECGTTRPDSFPSFGEARAASREDGWVTVGVDDFCPECVSQGCFPCLNYCDDERTEHLCKERNSMNATELETVITTSDPQGVEGAQSDDCTCFVTPEHAWFRYGSAVEPWSQMEPSPDCPHHFPGCAR